ncbi:MAG TPA: 30S ribosomal protein S16 [Candidatus Eremiobacteraceae bacterium]|nr:30S ribosomal protein S16 [Candidatus Eremiobacteraceae bacterium]
MSVKIRLRRTGAKKQPSYRFVVADSRSPRDGRFLEIVGHYNPRRTPVELVVDEEKIKRWLGNGAQPSDTVARLLAEKGLYDKSKVPVRKPRAPKKEKK